MEGIPIAALREMQALRRLSHPNIVRLLEVVVVLKGEVGASPGIYLVLDYMAHDLGGLLKRGVCFQPPHIMCLAKQMLDGLHYLHTRRLLNRDLKPANMLVSSQGQLRLADFGLARWLTAQADEPLTLPVCTRWYRPPEVLLGSSAYGFPVDLWSAGCILAEMFLRRPLFQGGRDGCSDADNDLDQYLCLTRLCGAPSAAAWPDSEALTGYKFVRPKPEAAHPRCLVKTLTQRIEQSPGAALGIDLIDKLLQLDPAQRLSADAALDHDFFWSEPEPCQPSE